MIGVAVVGLGWWGETVATSLAGNEKICVVMGVEPDEVRRAEIAGRLGLVGATEYGEALESSGVDAVILCTPHRLHSEQIRQAAAAGKHVFCEKPFTTNSDEAREALRCAKAANIQVGIGHERRFEPAIIQLQEMVRSGGLGVPLVFEGNFSQDKFLSLPPDNWRLSSIEAPVGPLSATGIHLVDLAISILGRPTTVLARLATLATTFANGDTLTILITFESGASAVITAVLATPFLGRVCVLGSLGRVEIRDRSHPERSMGWDRVTVLRDAEPQLTFHEPFPSVLANLEAFADAVEGRAEYPVSHLAIQQNVDTFQAITRSVGSGSIEVI